ncbi:DUF3159 domain-containing protein [Myceligenerans crystallogenes]|uniref:DUF3159 domain-containing protein n=1 Tax=Myceligenerans crystallogenes TaxID=316335 RepID=A0ABN2NK82_9MICO
MSHRADARQPEQSEQVPSGASPARGVAAVTGEDFSALAAIGGVRGLVESVLPGLVFVVAFSVTRDLVVPLVSAVAVAVILTVVRLVQRTPVTQALGGLVGVAIGVVWAWITGDAEDYFAGGLLVNALYLVPMAVSVLVRWPVVGLVVEALKSGLTPDKLKEAAAAADGDRPDGDRPGDRDADAEENPFAPLIAWRSDPELMRRYSIATWLWVGMFALRLAVKAPLYFAGEVTWLGAFHLLLGVPLWALVLFLTWVVVARRPARAAQA